MSTSLLQAQIAMMDFQASRYLITGVVPEQAGNDHPYLTPMGVFPTSDGFINIAVATEGQWKALCQVLDSQELESDERFNSIMGRIGHRKECNEAVIALTKTRESAPLIQALNDASVPSGPVYNMEQVFDDPQVQHLGIAVPVEHPELGPIKVVSQPFDMSRTPLDPFTPTPGRGEHSTDILQELGYDAGAISDLQSRNVI